MLTKMLGLPSFGKLDKKEKHLRAEEINLLDKDWLDQISENGVIYCKKLPKPWDEIMLAIMQFITVDDQTTVLYGFHLAFLNLLMGKMSFNIPYFIYHSLKVTCLELQKGVRNYPNHQGLM